MTAAPVRVSADWLQLREPADAAARASDLVGAVQQQLPTNTRAVIHDLGCGTGAMARWLAPQLTGAQHWVLYDRDPALLARAAADPPGPAADGAAVTAEIRRRDITRLQREELSGAALITASALLDMLTADEVDRLVATCAHAACPVLMTLSVVGRVELAPSDPLDQAVGDAFNAHQRRTAGRRRLLGPGAVGAVCDAFTRLGSEVVVRPSPWRLGAADAGLATEWLAGWLGAACEQRPELVTAARAYGRRRLAEARDGRLRVTVHHRDLLVTPV